MATPSDCYQRSPKLVVTDLGKGGVVVYAPPDPKPLKISSEIWQVLESFGERFFTAEEWNDCIARALGQSHSSFQDLNWLCAKGLLRVVEESSDTNSATQHSSVVDDLGESRAITLLTFSPRWPLWLRAGLLRAFDLQYRLLPFMLLVILSFIGFFIFSPAPIAEIVLTEAHAELGSIQPLTRILIGLLSVNFISTVMSWLIQSLTGLGDGRIVLRFLFGFIPRFGVNAYSGVAMHASNWTRESQQALLCVAQPLVIRLMLSVVLIALFTSGRLNPGLAGHQLYLLANVVLQISLISSVILALPFRMSPGYRIMILLTDLPSNTIGRSVSRFYSLLEALWRWIVRRDQDSYQKIVQSFSSRRAQALLLFAVVFLALLLAKLCLVLFIVIPRLAKDLPDVLGEASQLLFTLILLALLARFIKISIWPKIFRLTKRRSQQFEAQTDSFDKTPANDQHDTSGIKPSLRLNSLLLAFGTSALLLIPIDQIVSGSVVVSTERDLMVRAPQDVVITKILQQGPSTQLVKKGTPLILLESEQLARDLYQSEQELNLLFKDYQSLIESNQSALSVLQEMKESMTTYSTASQVMNDQILEMQSLVKSGAVSRQSIQDLRLELLQLEQEKRLKYQQVLEHEAEMEIQEIKLKAKKDEIAQAQRWNSDLNADQQSLLITMPFDGLIASSTAGSLGSFYPKGETLLELKQGSLNVVDVLIPDHDRTRLKLDQTAIVRLYAIPNQSLTAKVRSIDPIGQVVDEKLFFKASLSLDTPLNAQLFQSSGAARIKSGRTNLISVFANSLGRFIGVDLWSWTP